MIHIALAIAASTDRQGATAAEYALVATGIVGGVSLAVAALGTRVAALFNALP